MNEKKEACFPKENESVFLDRKGSWTGGKKKEKKRKQITVEEDRKNILGK